MTEIPFATRVKLGKIVRMFADETLDAATARGLRSTLALAGLDLHDLAELIEGPAPARPPAPAAPKWWSTQDRVDALVVMKFGLANDMMRQRERDFVGRIVEKWERNINAQVSGNQEQWLHAIVARIASGRRRADVKAGGFE